MTGVCVLIQAVKGMRVMTAGCCAEESFFFETGFYSDVPTKSVLMLSAVNGYTFSYFLYICHNGANHTARLQKGSWS